MVNLKIFINNVHVSEYLADALPTLSRTENHGSILTFSLVKTAKNYLKLNNVVKFNHDDNRIFLGNIVSISPRDEIIEIVCADGMHKLKGLGANYYYNHYRTRTDNKVVADGVDGNNLYLDVGSGINQIEQTPPPMYATNNDRYDVVTPGTYVQFMITFGNHQYAPTESKRCFIHQRFKVANKIMYGFQVKVESVTANVQIQVSICNNGGTAPGSNILTYTSKNNTNVGGYINFDFPSPVYLDPSQSYWFKLDNVPGAPSTSNSTNIQFSGTGGIASNDNWLNCGYLNNSNIYREIGVSPSGINTHDNYAVSFRVLTADHRKITSGTLSGSRYYINAVEGLSSLPTSIRLPVFNRGLVSYFKGSVTTANILELAFDAHGLTLNSNESLSTKGLLKYRCRGSYLSTYVDDLTSMIETDEGPYKNHQSLVVPSISVENKFYQKMKKNVSDASDLTVEWGVSQIISFTPTKTMTNRPAVQFIRSDIQNPQPGQPPVVMVSTVDMNAPLLTSEVLIDSGFTFPSDMFVQGYATLDSTARDAWEGTLELPDIVDVFDNTESSNTFGSGNIILMKHSGYGIDEKMKVKKATWDFQNWKTSIVLSNVPEFTNPRLNNLDKDRIQNQTTSLSLGENEGYLCAVFDLQSPIADNSARIMLQIKNANGTLGAMKDCLTIVSERYNTVTYHCYFAPGEGTINAEHGITHLHVQQITGAGIGDPQKTYGLRPSQYQDKYAEQGLTVDLVLRLTSPNGV